MIITIFGATGVLGKELVKQALNRDQTVRAFGRNVYTARFPENKQLQLLPGALFDEEQVLHAITGCDAVLSAVGGATNGSDKTRSLGMKNICTQMQRAGVQRIVALGGMGLLDASDDELIMAMPSFPKQQLAVSEEHLRAYEYLSNAGLNWTFVCAPEMLEGPPTGLYHTAANRLPEPNSYKINSGDLALFMLQELTDSRYSKQRVGISN